MSLPGAGERKRRRGLPPRPSPRACPAGRGRRSRGSHHRIEGSAAPDARGEWRR